MLFFSATAETAIRSLGSNIANGLSSAEAAERLARYGENKLQEKKKRSILLRFFDQFKDLMIIILLAAAAVSFAAALVEGESGELLEPILILLIVILNAVIGLVQESRAEKALDALKNLSAPGARVIRDGALQNLPASYLVPGDIIRLEAGDFVPADARLVQSASLKSEESALTGESVPAEKNAYAVIPENAPLGDRSNMVFSGCAVSYGTGTAIVTATGMDTEIGRIANLLDSEGEGQTPLQKKLSQLGRYMGILAILACGVVFAVGVLGGVPILEIFMTAVSLAVSAIPEGLPAIVTVVLSIGVQRMVKKNAIIRRLPAVETLGSASVICSDKTGTLTQNRMTLVKAWADSMEKAAAAEGDMDEKLRELLLYAALCSDAAVISRDGAEQLIGDPTEAAIVLAAHRSGMVKEDVEKKYPRLFELPFDSDRKLMTTVNSMGGRTVVIVKGAFDVLAERCIKGDIEKASSICDEMSRQALRVLAVAFKELPALPEKTTPETMETELELMGIVGMIDPPRPEAKAAVEVCRRAGIKPVMITGDHVITASAIAEELGILHRGDKAITGSQLDEMSDEQLSREVENISVYARVSPENKIRIVKAWQKKGHVVSMTGDGVNDAPALKAADIGCAMGITGTDVAKGAADMTLTDDNFATIVDAVREGRGIYANIKKVVGFLLGTNVGELISVFTAMLLWRRSPLLSIQLLWINLVTDSLPAIALGMEKVEDGVMLQKPKPADEGIFANGFGVRIGLFGALFGALTLVAYWLGEKLCGSVEGGRTMAFAVLALSQVVHSFNMRSELSLFKTGFFTNSRLNIAALISLVLVLAAMFTPLRRAFELIILPMELYLAALGLILVPLVLTELCKALGLIGRKE